MDSILSQFITKTSTDPGFARDLLQGNLNLLTLINSFSASHIVHF